MKSQHKQVEYTKKWRKTRRGMVTNLYHKMKGRCQVDFALEDLHKFAECKKFNRLFVEWEKSNYNKQFKPSIDRISNKKHYTIRNIHWQTWAENRFKQTMERRVRKYPVLQKMGDKVIKKYRSQRYAVRETGLCQSGISSCLNGRYKTCGGYTWEYEIIGNIHEDKK